MKKTLKIVGIALGAILAAALLLALTLPLWIGCVVRPVANTAVPRIAGTGFNLENFSLNWYNGRLEITGVKLYNPKEFDQKMAFTLGKVFVDIDMSTVFSDPMVIEKIEVKDVFVSYLDGSHGTNNFAVITSNVKDAFGIEDEDDEVEAEDVKTPEKLPEVAAEDGKDEGAEAGSGRKFIIDDLLIDSVVVQYGAMTLPLKVPIHMTGIGRDLGGLNAENAWKEIFAQFWKSLTNIGSNILNLGSQALEKTSGVVDALKVKEGASAATEAVSGAASSATEAVSGAASSATKAAGDGINKAADAVKGLFK